MRQKWNCKLMSSNRNHQLQNTSLKRLVLIRLLRLRIMTYSIMMLKFNPSWTCYLTNLSSKPLLRLKRSTSSRRSGGSSTNTTNVVNLKMVSGNKKSRKRYNASSRKTRHLIMQGWRESNNLRPCRSFSAWTLLRISCQPTSRRVCNTWLTRTTGEIHSKTSSMLTSKTGFIIPYLPTLKINKSRAISRIQYALTNLFRSVLRRTQSSVM